MCSFQVCSHLLTGFLPLTIAPFSQVGSAVRRLCEPPPCAAPCRRRHLCLSPVPSRCVRKFLPALPGNNLLPSHRSVQRSAASVNRPLSQPCAAAAFFVVTSPSRCVPKILLVFSSNNLLPSRRSVHRYAASVNRAALCSPAPPLPYLLPSHLAGVFAKSYWFLPGNNSLPLFRLQRLQRP